MATTKQQQAEQNTDDAAINRPGEALRESIRSLPTTGDVVTDLFNRAFALAKAKDTVRTLRISVRESLRNLDDAGVLTEAQAKSLTELFPPRGAGKADEDDDDDATGNGKADGKADTKADTK